MTIQMNKKKTVYLCRCGKPKPYRRAFVCKMCLTNMSHEEKVAMQVFAAVRTGSLRRWQVIGKKGKGKDEK